MTADGETYLELEQQQGRQQHARPLLLLSVFLSLFLLVFLLLVFLNLFLPVFLSLFSVSRYDKG